MKLTLSKTTIAAGAFLLLGGFAAQADAITMHPVLQDSDVEKIVAAAKQAMTANHTSGCIAVADADGQLLFLQRQDTAMPNCTSSAIAKVTTAAKFQTPTVTYNKLLADHQDIMLGVPELAPMPGGQPLFHDGKIVGAVAISTPDGDLDLKVVAAAAAVIK